MPAASSTRPSRVRAKKGKTGKAQMGIAFIRRLYVVENQLKDIDPEERTREHRR